MVEPGSGGYVHDILFYSSDDELLPVALPFLSEALDHDESVILACRTHHNRLLTGALGDHPRLQVVPRVGTAGRPAEAIAQSAAVFRRELRSGARRIRLMGEINFGATPREWAWWSTWEAVANLALANYPLWNVCLYHIERQPEGVLQLARLTHPHVVTPDRERTANPHYVEPAEFLRQLPSIGPHVLEQTTPSFSTDDLTDLAELRRVAYGTALASTTFPERQVEGFVHALSEVASNALVHGRPPVEVRLWAAHDQLLSTVVDHGGGFDDPLAGYVPLEDRRMAPGHGLWLARRMCDHIETAPTGDAFTVRLLTSR
ncbi:sensor histidine kinase [Actinopolymorpha sp. B17G11]|uniref:sensor histidine kinase n=1 Tax=Actinopolymorpha sp. B17G11 TaxID=3160861 RepID=UPI0032E4A6E1